MDGRTSLTVLNLFSTSIVYLLCLGLDNDDDYVSFVITVDARTNFLSSTEIFYLLYLGLDNDDDYVIFVITVDGRTNLSVLNLFST